MDFLKPKNGQLSMLELMVTPDEDELSEHPDYAQVVDLESVQNLKQRTCLGSGCSKKFKSSEHRFCENCRRHRALRLYSPIYEVEL